MVKVAVAAVVVLAKAVDVVVVEAVDVAVVVVAYVVDVAVVVVVVVACAGPWAGTATVRRAASVTRTRQAAMTVPTLTVFLKSIPARDLVRRSI